MLPSHFISFLSQFLNSPPRKRRFHFIALFASFAFFGTALSLQDLLWVQRKVKPCPVAMQTVTLSSEWVSQKHAACLSKHVRAPLNSRPSGQILVSDLPGQRGAQHKGPFQNRSKMFKRRQTDDLFCRIRARGPHCFSGPARYPRPPERRADWQLKQLKQRVSMYVPRLCMSLPPDC